MSFNAGQDNTWQKALIVATGVLVTLAAGLGLYAVLGTSGKKKKSKKAKGARTNSH